MKTWDAVLRGIGWPDRALVFDLESYFDKKVTLSKMSQTEYLAHPLFKLTCVGSGLVESGELHGTTDDLNGEIARLQEAYGRNLESVTVVGMNLFFDVGVLNDKFGILPPYTVDVRDLSHYLWPHEMKHALKNIAERLGLPCKGDTKEFLGYTPETAFPFMRDELAAYNERDLEITEKAFTKMLPMVGRPEWEIPFASHHLKMFCRDTMKIDRPALTKIAEILESKMIAAASVTEYTAKQLRSDKFTDYLLAIDPTVPLKDTKQGRRATVSKKDQELAGLLKHENPRVVALVQAKLIVEGMASFVSRCKKIMASADRVTDKLHIPFQFYKSHTGRSQGCGGINLGNLASRSGHEGDGIRDALRTWDGNWYLIGDFASIEARGVAWHANEKIILEAYRKNVDLYCRLAKKVFGCEVVKPKKGDTSPEAKEQTRMRQAGKTGELGSGFGMSGNGMANQMALAGQLGPGVDPELPNKLVETYRQEHPETVKMWKLLMDDCIAAVRYPGVLVSHTPSAWLYGKRAGEPMLTLILPSGREMYYGKAEVRRDRMGEHVQAGIGCGGGFKLWPGAVCENLVQGFCRDILVEKALTLEREGFIVVYHLYDSLAVLVSDKDKEERGDEIVKKYVGITTAPVSWLPGFPLGMDPKEDVKWSRHYD